MYAELASTAKEDKPQPAVEQFLALHASISRASLVADSLVKIAVTSPDQSPGGDPIPAEALKISADKRRRASSWVHAALATDLSPFSLYHHKTHPPPLPATAFAAAAVAVVLDGPSKTAVASSKTNSRQSPAASPAGSGSAKPSPAATPRGKARGVVAPPSPPTEWARGGGLEEGAELARALREDARGWFLGFAERFLDADVAAPGPSDREQEAGMLSQLKRVNDWLDGIGRRGEGDEAEATEVEGEDVRLREREAQRRRGGGGGAPPWGEGGRRAAMRDGGRRAAVWRGGRPKKEVGGGGRGGRKFFFRIRRE